MTRRVANLPDGAPAFDVFKAAGRRGSRIECIWNGWFDSDSLANRLLAFTAVMGAVLAKDGRIGIDDLGPALFDCVVVPALNSTDDAEFRSAPALLLLDQRPRLRPEHLA